MLKGFLVRYCFYCLDMIVLKTWWNRTSQIQGVSKKKSQSALSFLKGANIKLVKILQIEKYTL